MKVLKDFKEQIHKCSKCGLCQAECPIYKITGNDCSVSRGQFNMIKGVLNGDLKMSKTINRYLKLCLKCGACSKSCPSGIDAVDIVIAAKAEYFKMHFEEKIKTFFQKYFVFGLVPRIAGVFIRSMKSQSFSKKVLYFGGCSSKLTSDKSIVKILNSIGIEVINPNFSCCGIPYFSRGDLREFGNSIKNYISVLKKYDIDEVVTTCASCEKSLRDYIKWADDSDKAFLQKIKIKNIYDYLYENNLKLKLKKNERITYHKPCNISNFEKIQWFLNNIENLEYIEMKDFDKCCGLNGLTKFNEYKIMKKIYSLKRESIRKAKVNIVTTSCLGCEVALRLYSFGKYKVYDLLDFVAKNI